LDFIDLDFIRTYGRFFRKGVTKILKKDFFRENPVEVPFTALKSLRILFPYLSGRWICSQILKVGTAQGCLADVGCPVHEDLELAGDDLHEVPRVLAVLGNWAPVSSSSSPVPARQGPKFTPLEPIFIKLFG
jgi:hypothetical protein